VENMTKLTDIQVKKFQNLFSVEDLEMFLYALKNEGALDSEEICAVKLNNFLNEIKSK
jgi:succinate dehydrogenase flavin-adding protein (antitoxin of CptAB toxin-antitoxin module)